MRSAALALTFGAIAAFVATAAPLPMWYLPVADVLALGAKPPGLVIDYYGRVVAVVVAVLAGALAGRLAGRFVPDSVRLWKLALAWAAFAGAMSIGLSASQVWNRPVHPLTLTRPSPIAPPRTPVTR